ncbi:hypothetical protein LFL96_36720 (plasmid) [Paraburkholderia sp. D15]|uniref:hypothetical protein n=1 Tax=Paraburkholderia sp. D15 TaxID=2880218 RepID=UPI00247A0F67|nr:hypothetical protein [Paraburkholderia sp. D15]WGS55022.1 hypothetical protein LFL96_36720 [Paraburkholderia sp. D15]
MRWSACLFSDLLGATRPIHNRCREFGGDNGLGRFLHSMLTNAPAVVTRRNQSRDDRPKVNLLTRRYGGYTIFEKDNAIPKVEPSKGVHATGCRRVSVRGSMLDVQVDVSVNTALQTTQFPVANRVIRTKGIALFELQHSANEHKSNQEYPGQQANECTDEKSPHVLPLACFPVPAVAGVVSSVSEEEFAGAERVQRFIEYGAGRVVRVATIGPNRVRTGENPFGPFRLHDGVVQFFVVGIPLPVEAKRLRLSEISRLHRDSPWVIGTRAPTMKAV